MGKYSDLIKNVYSVFATAEWMAENIPTFPANYIGVTNGSDYIKVSVIPNGESLNLSSISGVVIADIFVKFGLGPNTISVIADKLDSYLVGRKIDLPTGSTQFLSSSLNLIGMDPDNNGLYRAKYETPFLHFGN